MIIYRPTVEEIDYYVGRTFVKTDIPLPTNNKGEWDKSHRDFVLRVLLPAIKPPEKVWRITAEAYLTDIYLEQTKTWSTFEQVLSDGSTVVKDVMYTWGNIKDPWAVAHDLVYILHKLHLDDMYNHQWGLYESHNMYRDGWVACGKPITGTVWWMGLYLGGWVLWHKPFKNEPEMVTAIKSKLSCIE